MTTPEAVVYFGYGLAFIIMGTAILFQPRTRSELTLAAPLPWLAAFGFVHGLHEWLEVLHLSGNPHPAYPTAAAGLLTTSFLLLYEFGRRLVRLALAAAGRWRRVVELLTDPRWYPLTALLLSFIAYTVGPEGFAVAVRYLLAVPAALATAVGFLLYSRNEASLLGPLEVKPYFHAAAVAFAGYAVAAGLLVPPADFFPADRFNAPAFFGQAEVPVYFLRALFALTATVSIVLVLRIFDREMAQRLRQALDHANRTLDRLGQVTSRHEQILHIAGCGLVGIDRDGCCRFVNRAALNLLGYEEPDLVGKSFVEAVACTTTAQPLSVCPVQTAIEAGRQSFRDDVRFQRRDGRHIAVEFLSEPVYEKGELAGGIVLSFTDITSRKEGQRRLLEMAASLAEKTKSLERVNAELEQYAYVAAHDLKAPVRAVSMLSHVIAEDIDAGRLTSASEHSGLLRERARRINRYIDDLLEYARAGEPSRLLERLDLQQVIREIVDFLAPPAGFEIEIDLGPDPPRLTASRVALEQVFGNLIANAINHHHRESGRIVVRSRPIVGGYRFSVQDDGPGIPREHHQTVLQVFQVLDGRRRNEHTGLGLALVKKVVEAHGGELRIDSERGEGTTISFDWPDHEHGGNEPGISTYAASSGP